MKSGKLKELDYAANRLANGTFPGNANYIFSKTDWEQFKLAVGTSYTPNSKLLALLKDEPEDKKIEYDEFTRDDIEIMARNNLRREWRKELGLEDIA